MSMMQSRSFIRYKNYRYLYLSGILVTLATISYLTIHPGGSEHHGGTWLGYVLGVTSMLILFLHVWYGIRKRLAPRIPDRRSLRTDNDRKEGDVQTTVPPPRKERRRLHLKESWRFGGTLQGWLSAHVYLGIALVVLASLHAGFHFGWNVHTLTYVLMLLIVVTGCYGTFAYLYYPKQITRNLNGATTGDVLKSIRELEESIIRRAIDLPDEANRIVLKARQETRIGGNLFQQLSGIQHDCPTVAAVQYFKKTGLDPAFDHQKQLVRELYYLSLKKKMLVSKARKDIAMRARMQCWLYLHAPLSIALLAALFVHIWAIFFYW
ncbi:MAG: hypothetical protein HQL95_01560 [Magnetococcales bacterium]|nr:hypothetical protein [Magnetococcales bacterium]